MLAYAIFVLHREATAEVPEIATTAELGTVRTKLFFELTTMSSKPAYVASGSTSARLGLTGGCWCACNQRCTSLWQRSWRPARLHSLSPAPCSSNRTSRYRPVATTPPALAVRAFDRFLPLSLADSALLTPASPKLPTRCRQNVAGTRYPTNNRLGAQCGLASPLSTGWEFGREAPPCPPRVQGGLGGVVDHRGRFHESRNLI